MQDIQNLPPILHSAAGSGILSDGGDGAQDGCSIFSLQSSAANNHHWTLCRSNDLHTEGTQIYVTKDWNSSHTMIRLCVCIHHLAERMCTISQLLQHGCLLSQVVICETEVDAVTHHGNMQLIVEPADWEGWKSHHGLAKNNPRIKKSDSTHS